MIHLFYCLMIVVNFLALLPAYSLEDENYHYNFAICAIFQNEAPYLKEWIEYHRLVGTQHFYLYNNSSQDEYLAVLQPYIEDGVVELVEWPDPDFQIAGQQKAYMDAIQKTRDKVKWLAIIDVDEYLVPKTHDTIPAFLHEFDQEGIGGVGINWQMFGTSFVPKLEHNQLLTEELTLKAHEQHSENFHIKSIIRPEYVMEHACIHHFDYRDGYAQVNANKEPFNGPFSPYIATDKMQINHYWTKDESFLYETKIPRRQQWGESLESIENRVEALNQVKDTSIARFLPYLRQIMFPNQTIRWEAIHLDFQQTPFQASYRDENAEALAESQSFSPLQATTFSYLQNHRDENKLKAEVATRRLTWDNLVFSDCLASSLFKWAYALSALFLGAFAAYKRHLTPFRR